MGTGRMEKDSTSWFHVVCDPTLNYICPLHRNIRRFCIFRYSVNMGMGTFTKDHNVFWALGGKRGSAFSVIRSTWGWEPLQKTIMYFGLWAAKEVFLNIFKYWLMVHAFGMAREHYNLIIGPRSDWTGK